MKSKTKKKTNKKSITRKYKTTRTIRGVKRKVEVSIGKDKKESIKMIKPMNVGRKKEKRIPLPKESAKNIHSLRSKKSRNLDESKTNKKKITDTRRKKNPGKFDYPGVDSKKTNKERKTQQQKEKKAPKVNKPKRKSRIDKVKKMKKIIEEITTKKTTTGAYRVYRIIKEDNLFRLDNEVHSPQGNKTIKGKEKYNSLIELKEYEMWNILKQRSE